MTDVLDLRTAVLFVGGLFILLPLMAWTILARRHDRAATALWCGGGLLYGAAVTLIALRSSIPSWLFGLAGLASIASYPLRAFALGRDLGRARPAWLPLGAIGALSLLYVALFAIGEHEAPFLLAVVLAHAAGAAWIAWLAWQLFLARTFRSAALLSASFGLFAAALLLRGAMVFVRWQDAQSMAGGADFVLVFVAGIVAVLYSNLGYVGLALETTRAAELSRIAQLARETEERVQTERRAVEQGALLAERELLLRQNRDMLAVLAHEVRQPLNNASAALQSAAQTILEPADPAQRLAAASRLDRANAVLLQVTATLDNTLTDAVLLQDDATPTRHDVDIDTVVNMAIGDIDPRTRPRVRRQRTTGTRTASMNAGLMRLALRNLIANALAYSPEGSPVTVRIDDSDEPLALLIDVIDRGPGIPAKLMPRLFERGARGDGGGGRLGHGLGLYIVHRVLALHEGEVQVIQGEEPGLTMRLVIPQGLTG